MALLCTENATNLGDGYAEFEFVVCRQIEPHIHADFGGSYHNRSSRFDFANTPGSRRVPSTPNHGSGRGARCASSWMYIAKNSSVAAVAVLFCGCSKSEHVRPGCVPSWCVW